MRGIKEKFERNREKEENNTLDTKPNYKIVPPEMNNNINMSRMNAINQSFIVTRNNNNTWKRGDKCEIFSTSSQRWFSGLVIAVINTSVQVEYYDDYGNKKQKTVYQHDQNVIRRPVIPPFIKPINMNNKGMNNNNNINSFRPPPPHTFMNNNNNNNNYNNNYNNGQQYQGQKHDHNFRNNSYNKKENIRTNKNNQTNDTEYDSDESVFVTQEEIARRHSWGSSNLEPHIKQQPFGKPIHINNHNNNHNNTKNMVSKLELTEK
eukprot:188828_1